MSLMLRRLWIQLTADRKRFGLLCAMLTVGLLLWARVIVVSNIPRTAAATDGNETPLTVDRNLRTNTAVINRLARESVKVRLDDAPQRDPFVISTDYFPKPRTDGELLAEAAKSDREHVEDESDVQSRLRRDVLRREIERLKLEAVMRGAGLAVISGRTYRVGDEVPGRNDESVVFEIIEVKQRSVVLRNESHEFELELDSPM